LTDFLAKIERLFAPIEGWGEFRPGSRHAAVAFILYREDGRWQVPFVRRRADLRDHPGQVALPGGGVKAGESAWDAARREVTEEIGVPAEKLVPLGAGELIYTSVSNFSVVPFVAHIPEPVPPFVYDKESWTVCSRFRSTGCSTTARGESQPPRGDSGSLRTRRASCGA